MKRIGLLAFTALVSGCAGTDRPFVQNGIRIVPPVHQEQDLQGNLVLVAYNDGGTKRVRIRDSEGRTFDVYFDHRLVSDRPGGIYLFAYPGRAHSPRIIDEREFRRSIVDERR